MFSNEEPLHAFCMQDMGTAATAPASGGRKRFGLAPLRQIFRSGRAGTAGGVQLPGDSMPLRSPSESMEEP